MNRENHKVLLTASNGFACLTYHVIGEGQNQYVVSEGQFREQLATLKGEGYVVDGFEELEARRRSNLQWPSRYTVFTMDDGNESSMRAADLLEAHGFRGTFFLTRDRCIWKPGFIRDAQIRDLRKRGFSVGTHGTTHRKLTFLAGQECLDELKGSKLWLEDVLGENVHYMAAPGGFVNARVKSQAYAEGYVLIGTCSERMNSPTTLRLPGPVSRVNVRRQFSMSQFRKIIEGYPGFYLWRQLRAAALAVPKQFQRA